MPDHTTNEIVSARNELPARKNEPIPERHNLSPARRAELLAFFGGFSPADHPAAFAPPPDLLARLTDLPPGSIAFITGPSGSGKSTLLRAAAARFPRITSAESLRLPSCPLINALGPRVPVREVIGAFARLGLAEAGLLHRTPAELSDGQRWRLRLALALHRARRKNSLLVCDEFTSLLDPLTAHIAAATFRRALSATGQRALLATWRADLTAALRPHHHITCDFGQWRFEDKR